MTWKDYIMPIQKSGISGDAVHKILRNIFEQAGCAYVFSDEAAKKWLMGERQCKASKYFPTGQVDTDSLFRYFRNRPDDRLCQLQQLFREEESVNASSPIDVKTDNWDVFCWSLVNQFLDLLRFQRVDIPHTDTLTKTAFPESDHLLDIQEVDISKSIISEQMQGTIPQADSMVPIDHTVIPPKEMKRSIRSTILPHSDDCCYRCTFWNGNRKAFGAYITATYGPCLKHNNLEQLSSNSPCKDYKRRQKLVGEW